MERKDFLVAAGSLCGAAFFGNLLTGCKKSDPTVPSANFTIDLSDAGYAALLTTGGSINKNSINIVNTGSGYIAVSAVCTHEGCIVNYSNNKFVCPCHGGVYNISGGVVSGPPPSALKKYTVTQSGTVLTIT